MLTFSVVISTVGRWYRPKKNQATTKSPLIGFVHEKHSKKQQHVAELRSAKLCECDTLINTSAMALLKREGNIILLLATASLRQTVSFGNSDDHTCECQPNKDNMKGNVCHNLLCFTPTVTYKKEKPVGQSSCSR